jgi:hypothetical protein
VFSRGRVTEKELDRLLTAATEGARAVRAFLTYQGTNKDVRSTLEKAAKQGGKAVSAYNSARRSAARRIA